MAYLHCHSCDWEQDDFWSWEWTWKFWKFRAFGYNPISLMIEDVAENIKPRYIEFDRCFAIELGSKSNRIFSWRVMVWGLKRHVWRLFNQKWWTWESWQKDRDKAVCPKCGKRDFDID